MSPPFPSLPGQRGLATTRQLRDAGWTEDAIRHLVARRGRRLFPNVISAHRGPLSEDDRLTGAWLWAGPDACLTGCRALARHGLDVPRIPSVTRFLIPSRGRARSFGGAQVVRTRRPERSRQLEGLPVVGVERALADAGRYAELTASEAQALTIAALQRRLTTVERLEAEVLASRRNGLAGVRAGIDEYRQGAWSLPEARLLDLVSGHPGIPPMLANPRLTTPEGQLIGVPDGYFADCGVAVQVHSRTHHSGADAAGRDQWAKTVEADTDFERHGIVVVGITPQRVASTPDGVLRTIMDVLSAHRGRTPPDVVIEPAGSRSRRSV